MQLLRSSNKQLIALGPANALGVGGEARIYTVPGAPGLAAKVYHRPTADHAAKLSAMLGNPPEEPVPGTEHASIAWPTELLLSPDHRARVLGFLMPLVDNMAPIIDFYHPKTRRFNHPLFNYLYLLRMARNLAGCAAALHARGYVIGDLNESNILVSDTALVTLVDTDSFQVPDSGNQRVFRCRVGKPEFTPPELQGASFGTQDRQPEHDMFGLAVLLFQVLMEGTHPFAGRHFGTGEPPSLEMRIAAGQFPYVRGTGPASLPMRAAPPFESLHPALRDLFIRCFVEGHTRPERRPDALTWQHALEQAESALATCTENEQHRFGTHLNTCPWCERQRLLHGLDPFPSIQAVQLGQHRQSTTRRRRPPPARRHFVPVTQTPPPPPPMPTWRRHLWKAGLGLLGFLLLLYWAWTIRLALAHH